MTRTRHHRSLCLVTSLLLLLVCVPAIAQDPAATRPPAEVVTVRDIPTPVVGATICRAGDALVVAGGYDQENLGQLLRDTPPSANIQVLDNTVGARDGDGAAVQPPRAWQAFLLKNPVAFGATASIGNSVYIIGGTDGERPIASVTKLTLRRVTGQPVQIDREVVTALPEPIAMGSADVIGGEIYFAGGLTSLDPLEFNQRLYIFNPANPAAGWRAAKDVPRPGYAVESDPELRVAGRVLGAAVAQTGAFHYFGGWSYEPGPDPESGRWIACADGWRYEPGKENDAGYRPVTPAPAPLANAGGAPVGQAHIVLGGVRSGDVEVPTLEAAVRSTVDASDELLVYGDITDAWFSWVEWPRARPGTTLIRWDINVDGGRAPGLLAAGGIGSDGRPAGEIALANLRQEKSFGHLEWGVMGVYLLGLVVIGSYFSRREKSGSEFFVGGRRMPWWAVAVSVQATGASAISFMAIPAKAYATDLVYMGTFWVGVLAAIIIAIYLVPIYYNLGVISIYSYLEQRFHLSVRLLGSSLFLLAQIGGRLSVVMLLPSLALAAVTGMNIFTCILILGAFSTLYTALGGIQAVIWSDVLQFCVMMGGAAMAMIFVFTDLAGGFGQALDTWVAYDKLHAVELHWDLAVPSMYILILGGIFSAFTFASEQTQMQRIMATNSLSSARKAVVWQWILAVPMTFIWLGLGLTLFVFYRENPSHIDPTLTIDTVFPQFIHRELPPGIKGLLIAGLFSAAMSSLDSAMNSSATVLVTDGVQRFKPGVTEQTQVLLGRCFTILIGALGTGIALIVATFETESLWDIFIRITAVTIGGFPGVFLLGMLTRRANTVGAIAGLLASVGVLATLPQVIDVHVLLQGPLAMVVCIVVGYTISLITPVRTGDLQGLTIYSLRKKAGLVNPN